MADSSKRHSLIEVPVKTDEAEDSDTFCIRKTQSDVAADEWQTLRLSPVTATQDTSGLQTPRKQPLQGCPEKPEQQHSNAPTAATRLTQAAIIVAVAASVYGLSHLYFEGSRHLMDKTWTNILYIGVVLPFFGRAIVDFVFPEGCAAVYRRCQRCRECKARATEQRPPGALDAWQARSDPSSFTYEDVCSQRSSSWSDMLAKTGQTHCRATTLALLRLLLWHIAQPVGYFVAFAINVSELSGLQLCLATAVCAREVVYLLATVACVLICPSFLVVDVRGSVRNTKDNYRSYENGVRFLALYVLAPDKYVFGALFTSLIKFGVGHGVMHLVCIFSGIADFCGVAALSAGFVSRFLPPELAVGYAATALAGLCLLWTTLVANHEYHRHKQRDATDHGRVYSQCGYVQMQAVMVLFPIVVASWPILAVALTGLIAGCVILGLLSVMAALTAQYTLHPQRVADDGHLPLGVAMVFASIVLVVTSCVLMTVHCVQMDKVQLSATGLAILPTLTTGLLASLLFRNAACCSRV